MIAYADGRVATFVAISKILNSGSLGIEVVKWMSKSTTVGGMIP